MLDARPDVRKLASGDERLAGELNALFAETFDDQATYRVDRPDRAHLRRLLAKDDLIILVAWVGSELAGALVAYELLKLERARPEIYLYDLAVREAHRRQGVATSLIDELKHIARSRNAWVIFVQADYGDEPAIALYRKLGRQKEVLHFDLLP
jgi:aminoglycoside 3-N-acetyltransferase I